MVTVEALGAIIVTIMLMRSRGSERLCDLSKVIQQNFESNRLAESTDSYPLNYILPDCPRPLTVSIQCCLLSTCNTLLF